MKFKFVKSQQTRDYNKSWQKRICHTLVLSQLQIQFQNTSLQKYRFKILLKSKCGFQVNNFGSFSNTMFILGESKTMLSCHLFARIFFL
jgi:hypothetical protein